MNLKLFLGFLFLDLLPHPKVAAKSHVSLRVLQLALEPDLLALHRLVKPRVLEV
jgi:hypothetical protein